MTLPRLLAILTAMTLRHPASGGEEARSGRIIEIKAGKMPVALGAPIELRVTYRNRTDRIWKLEQPDTSDSVKVTYQPVKKSDIPPVRFSLSRKTTQEVKLPNGTTQIVQVVPPRKELEIKPGEKLEFGIDLDSHWTDDLAPGAYEAWIEDSGQGLQSDKCTFTIAFSRDSIAPLLSTVARENESPARRKWCAGWLKRIKPDFELKLRGATDTSETVKRLSQENARALEELKAFWSRVKDSPEIEAVFAKAAATGASRAQPTSPRKEGAP